MIGTQLETNILNTVKIPQYQKTNPAHKKIAKLSKQLHRLKAKEESLESLKQKLDDAIESVLTEH